MTYDTLIVTVADKVATVTLNRPDLRNAFNEGAIAELTRVFDELGRDDAVRTIVLAANGPSFCAGADLNWMKKMAGYSHDENEADAMRLADMLRTIYLCPKPVVARVQGDCYAGGMGLVAACDIVVASETAGFCLSEVKLGLIPATISPYVIKAMGEQAARRYFITAERFDAAEAQRIGVAHAVVATEFIEHARQFGNRLFVEGIAQVGAVQRDGGDLVGDGHKQGVISHRHSLTCGTRRTSCRRSAGSWRRTGPGPARCGYRPGRSRHRPTGAPTRNTDGPGARTGRGSAA